MFAALLILTLALDKPDHQRDSARAEVETLSADLVKQNAAVEQMKNESTKQISNLLIAQEEAERACCLRSKGKEIDGSKCIIRLQ